MKQILILFGAISLAILINMGTVDANKLVENRIPTDYQPQKPASKMEPTYIDGVPIPYEILVYAQVVYQGYAITQANVTTWNGAKAYQLRIDNDSNPNDADGMYLIYDVNWVRVGDKPLNAPLPRDRKTEVIKIEDATLEFSEENENEMSERQQENNNEEETDDTAQEEPVKPNNRRKPN